MITDEDIAAYLRRLGVDAEPPSVEALFRLHRAQLEHVPYETTWIHMDERWGVDRAESLRRIAHQRTGGYCFHLNGALSLLLDHLGYDVSLHIGGVHGPDGPNEEAMRNHLVLQVHGLPAEGNERGDWYVDAGLGDALHEPLPLVAGSYWQGPFEFDLAVSDSPVGDWRFAHHPGGSFTGMAFRSAPATIDDFAERNVHLSTSPESGFVRLLTVQRRDADGVDVMRGLVLSRVGASSEPGETIESSTEWFEVLADRFGLPLDHVAPERKQRLWSRTRATHDAWVASQEDGPG
ncbi:MAG: arylamine N-acetyltransferase [Ilumatobacteraceae bacterium]